MYVCLLGVLSCSLTSAWLLQSLMLSLLGHVRACHRTSQTELSVSAVVCCGLLCAAVFCSHLPSSGQALSPSCSLCWAPCVPVCPAKACCGASPTHSLQQAQPLRPRPPHQTAHSHQAPKGHRSSSRTKQSSSRCRSQDRTDPMHSCKAARSNRAIMSAAIAAALM